jgi:Methyltransferase domain
MEPFVVGHAHHLVHGAPWLAQLAVPAVAARRDRLEYVVRAARTVLWHPREGAGRVRGRLDRRMDKRGIRAAGGAAAAYAPVDEWAPALDGLLGHAAPDADQTFDLEWRSMVQDLTGMGLRVGRASYGGWNDGDVSFAGACWRLVRDLRPRRVVETGVAHGLTSRLILAGLAGHGDGELWSIDLKAPDTRLHETVGAAVPDRLRDRWHYVEGSSRRRLRPLLTALGEIDLFVHDSLHTGRNVRFELSAAWSALRPGGALLVDDVNHSLGFRSFVHAAGCRWLTARHSDGGGMWGVAVKATR